MGTMTIFTETFGNENYSEIESLSNVGNMTGMQIHAISGNDYLCAKNCHWDELKTFIADETLSDADWSQE